MILRLAHLFHEIFLVHAIHGESLPRSRLNRWKKKKLAGRGIKWPSPLSFFFIPFASSFVLVPLVITILSLSLSPTRSSSNVFPPRSSSFFPPLGFLLLLVFPGHHPSAFLLLVPLIVPLFFARDVPRRLSLSLSLSRRFLSHLLTSPRGESFSLHVQSLTFRRAVDRQP